MTQLHLCYPLPDADGVVRCCWCGRYEWLCSMPTANGAPFRPSWYGHKPKKKRT